MNILDLIENDDYQIPNQFENKEKETDNNQQLNNQKEIMGEPQRKKQRVGKGQSAGCEICR